MAKPKSLRPFERRGRPSQLSVEDMNKLVALLNKLINLRINPYATAPGIEWDELGPIIHLRTSSEGEPQNEPNLGRVRVTICNADTGQLEQWELYGRKL